VCRELKRPGCGEQPSPDEPAGERRLTSADVGCEPAKRGERQDVQEYKWRLGHRRDSKRHTDEQGLQRPGDLALRPDDIRAEVRPGAGRVVSQAHQVDLGLVFRPEFRRQAEGETAEEEGSEGADPDPVGKPRFQI
jgi:hypothetical protein